MLESVVTHYSNQIGEFKELSLLSGGQGANENFKLITSKAEYLFKICDEKSQKGLDLWLASLKHLQQHNFPTAYVIPTNDNKPYVNHEGRNIVIFEFLKGSSLSLPDLTPKIMENMGISVAKLHIIPTLDSIPSNKVEGCCMICEADDFLVDVKADSELSQHPFSQVFEKRLPFLKSHLYDQPIHQSIIHTDIFPDNVMCDNGNVTLVDFEEMCQGFSMIDIGIVLMACCIRNNELDVSLARSFLQGYNSIRPLSELEFSLIPNYIELSCWIFAFWRFRNFNVKKKKTSSEDELNRYKPMMDNIQIINEWKEKGGLEQLRA